MSYDDDDYEDYEEYEEELNPLSKKELALIEADYTIPVSDDHIEEITHLITSYSKIKKLDPEIEYEEEMKEYALDTIRAILEDYDIPCDDIVYLFKFVLAMELLQDKFSSMKRDEILSGHDSLFVRIKEYMDEYPDLFCDIEVYDAIFDIDKKLTSAPTYKRVLTQCYEDLIASGSVESLAAVVQLYNEGKPMADTYVEKSEIPNDNEEEFKKAFLIITGSKKQGSSLKKHFHGMKEIIQQQYPEDPEMKVWAEAQQLRETKALANKYNMTKFGTAVWAGLIILMGLAYLIYSLVMGFIEDAQVGGILLGMGIVFGGIWAAVFLTSMHDKIPFLRNGKAAVLSLKGEAKQ